MSQIKYIKCVSLVIRNFTVSWFKSDFLKKSFAGINFHGFDKSKHFAGTNFRDLVLAKIGTIKAVCPCAKKTIICVYKIFNLLYYYWSLFFISFSGVSTYIRCFLTNDKSYLYFIHKISHT